jgi:hypothetical protein
MPLKMMLFQKAIHDAYQREQPPEAFGNQCDHTIDRSRREIYGGITHRRLARRLENAFPRLYRKRSEF